MQKTEQKKIDLIGKSAPKEEAIEEKSKEKKAPAKIKQDDDLEEEQTKEENQMLDSLSNNLQSNENLDAFDEPVSLEDKEKTGNFIKNHFCFY